MSTNPTDKQMDVDKGTKVTITFSKAMDKTATMNAVSISPGTITNKTWSADTSLILTVDLGDGQEYTVTISTGAKDAAGTNLASGYTFTFTTRGGGTGDKILGLDVTTFSLLIVIIIVVIVVAIVAALIMMRKKKAQPPMSPPMENYSFYGQQQGQSQTYYPDQGQQPGQQQPYVPDQTQPPPPGY